jgi:hypothetical protein
MSAFNEILKHGGNNGSVCLQFSLLFLSFAMFRLSFRTSIETVKRKMPILLFGTKPLPSNQYWLSRKTFAECHNK